MSNIKCWYDKPGKYPKAFRTSQALVISKLDLLPHVPFSVDSAKKDALLVQPDLTVVPVCALTGEGMEAWCDLLVRQREDVLSRTNASPTTSSASDLT